MRSSSVKNVSKFADTGKQGKGYVSIHNICGDLNKGYIPRNPMKQKFDGSAYPL